MKRGAVDEIGRRGININISGEDTVITAIGAAKKAIGNPDRNDKIVISKNLQCYAGRSLDDLTYSSNPANALCTNRAVKLLTSGPSELGGIPTDPISADLTPDTPDEPEVKPEVKPIVVPTTSIKGLKAYKKALEITWTAKKNADGYVIQYSTNKKFKNAKKIVVDKAKAKSKKITKLKAKKRYYLRI